MLVYAAMIEFQDVTKRFGRAPAGVAALDRVSVAFAAGATTAIVGPNGAGKSTMLGLTLGFLQPSGGAVMAGGMRPRAWVRTHGAAWLPERFRLPADWRVLPALRSLARLEGLSGRDADRRSRENLERFGLADAGHRRIGTLSRGMLQRVGLAQATLVVRQLVVFDEPTEGLDAAGRVLFRDGVTQLRAAGATVLLASHDLNELERLADRAVVLDSGRVREILELDAAVEGTRWTLRLTGPSAAVGELFPGAVRMDGRTEPGPAEYAVAAANAADMSARLAALLASGATLIEVTALRDSLEQRIEQALQTEAPGSGEPLP